MGFLCVAEDRCQPRRPYHLRGAESVVYRRGSVHQITRHARHSLVIIVQKKKNQKKNQKNVIQFQLFQHFAVIS